MPSGVYIRTKPRTQKQLEHARRMGKLAKTEAQLDHCRELNKQPRTQLQREASRKNGRKAGLLSKTEKQREACRKLGLNSKGKPHPHGPTLCADTIIEHHNDLKHGVLRPDDVVYMTNSEHTSLHDNLRVKNGTHPFLTKNRKE